MISNLKITSNFTPNLQRKMVTNPSFCSNNSEQDKFETLNKNKKRTGLEWTLMAATGASLSALAITKGRLTQALEIASKDGMTGLFNKNTLLKTVENDFKRTIQGGKEYSIAMLDMDNFKGINEVFNHGVGDIVLKRIASNIQEVSGKHGAKGFRYGGEEFVITMPGLSKTSSYEVTKEIAESIKKDEAIQKYVPSFIEMGTEKLDFVSKELKKLDELFPKLRREFEILDYRKLANQVVSVLKTYNNEHKGSQNKISELFIKRLESTKASDLSDSLTVYTELSGGSTLGEELNKIYSQYKATQNDLNKWLDHLKMNSEKNKVFTVSGGVVTFDKTHEIKTPELSIKVADAALKSAKENGKNTIIEANNDLIKMVVDGQI